MSRRVRVRRLEHVARGGIDHDRAVAGGADLRPGLDGKHHREGDDRGRQGGQTRHKLASTGLRFGHSLRTSGGSLEL